MCILKVSQMYGGRDRDVWILKGKSCRCDHYQESKPLSVTRKEKGGQLEPWAFDRQKAKE